MSNGKNILIPLILTCSFMHIGHDSMTDDLQDVFDDEGHDDSFTLLNGADTYQIQNLLFTRL